MTGKTGEFDASLIMSPTEHRLYKDWQVAVGDEITSGNIAFAVDYEHFLRWRSATFSIPNKAPFKHETFQTSQTWQEEQSELGHIAAICGHPLHPTDLYTEQYCLVCEVKICLRFQKAIADAWEKLGGPWNATLGYDREKYVALRRAWHMTQVEFLNILDGHRDMAEAEVKWNTGYPDEHENIKKVFSATNTGYPDEHENIKKVFSATKSLAVAAAESKYPATFEDQVDPNLSVIRKNANNLAIEATEKKAKRTIRFTSDTKLNQAPRPYSKFCRTSPRYQPGEYEAPPGEEWSDTSFMHDPLYALSQYRVALTEEGCQLDLTAQASYENEIVFNIPNIIEDSMTAGDLDIWDDIRDGWAPFALSENLNEREEFASWLKKSHMLAVIQSDGVLDTCFICTDDCDEANTPPHTVQGRWITYADCASNV